MLTVAKSVNLVGRRFGRLTALSYAPRKVHGGRPYVSYRCKCDCGVEKIVIASSLLCGSTQSCGCLNRERVAACDLTGKRFGRLTVLAALEQRKARYVQYECRCKCGNIVRVTGSALRNGVVRSCGCLRVRHGYSAVDASTKKLFNVWLAMHGRCYNKSDARYKDYGGRGIRVCRRWQYTQTAVGFKHLLSDMGLRPDGMSIDRINNDKGYSPKNCRWATAKQQQENKRPRKAT